MYIKIIHVEDFMYKNTKGWVNFSYKEMELNKLID